MTTIKKITVKTFFFVTAIVGFSFISTIIGKLFLGGAEASLTKLESVTDKDKIANVLIPNALADTPAGGGGGGDSDSSGCGCGGSGGCSGGCSGDGGY